MAAPRVDPDDLAATGLPDPLLSRLVALDLRHAGLTLLLGRLPRPPAPSPARRARGRGGPAGPRRSSLLAPPASPPSRLPGSPPERACGLVRRGSWACGAKPS